MAGQRGSQATHEQAVVPCGPVLLQGDLDLPHRASGIVLFAHGSGSSRFSPRNRFVAEQLTTGGLATLLFDLLTEEEEQVDRFTMEHRFDIDLLTERLVCATDWVLGHRSTKGLAIGYFGASTGAAAALFAAARRPQAVRAVVSRGGRPDLAGPALARVQTPTLLIVGGRDFDVLRLNEEALAELPGTKKLEIVEGATHLFEEPGTLEAAARLAREWFQLHLVGISSPTAPASRRRHTGPSAP